jgi:hypothetical protein
MRSAANGDDAAVGLRELDLHAMKTAAVVGDEVVVAVLPEGDRETAASLQQVGGNPELGEVAFELERSHILSLKE